jgi:hypothetical protein
LALAVAEVELGQIAVQMLLVALLIDALRGSSLETYSPLAWLTAE